MNNWLIVLLPLGGAVAALLGILIQIIYSKTTEDKKRMREVREKRIDKTEEFINYMFKRIGAILYANLEIIPEISEGISFIDFISDYEKKLDNIIKDQDKSIKQFAEDDENDITLFTICAYSLHDTEIDKLLKEMWEFVDELNEYHNKLHLKISQSTNPKEFVEKNKAGIEKLLLLKATFKKLLIGFYNRLDYLRAK